MPPRGVARAERGPVEQATAAPGEKRAAGVPAEQDLLIERPDLGPGACTLIAAGDPVPPELAGLPRKPRAAKARGG